MLMRILGHMITSKCFIGVLTDGHTSVFLLLKSLGKTASNKVIEVDWYLNVSSERADDDEKLTARLFMIGLLGYVMGSGSLDYLRKKQRIFGNMKEWAFRPFFVDIHTPANITVFCEALVPLFGGRGLQVVDLSVNREIVYNIPESDRLQYCQGHFHIFSIPKRELEDHIDRSGDEDVIAVVFDASITKTITNDNNDPSLVSKLWDKLLQEVENYSKIQQFNQSFPAQKINTAIIKIGFFSFWEEKKEVDSYIASGPTIIV